MNIEKSKFIPYTVLLIIILLAVLLRYSTLKHHVVPTGDEGSFLSLALNLKTGKGFTNNVIWHYYHRNESLPYPEDTRHPLYPALIAALGHVTGIAMRPAQWLNIIFGIILLFMVYTLGKRLHSTQAGLIASFLTAISWPLIKYSAHVYSEMLFALLVLIIVWLYTNRKENVNWERGNFLLIGGGIGLSYLCRPNGIFLFAAAIIFAIIYNRKSAVWIISGFFVLAIWWMGRNFLVFGNPLYGHFNYFMWIDSHHELWYTISDLPPGMASFLQSHSFGDIMSKFLRGLQNFIGELWQFEGLTLPLTKILFPFFAWFLFRRKYHNRVWYFISIYFFITLIPVIWTASVIWVARYLLVFYPFYFLAAAIGILEINWSKLTYGRLNVFAAVVLIVIIMMQFYPLRFLTSKRNGDVKEYYSVSKKATWIRNNTDKNSAILAGSITQNQYEIDRYMIHYPRNESLEKAVQFSKKHGCTELLVDKKLIRSAKDIEKYWELNGSSISEKEIPQYLLKKYLDEDFGVYTVK